MTELTDDTFDTYIENASLPVLVDFWAEWCVPCKRVKPILDELACEYGGHVSIMEVNTAENPELVERFNVQAIPTLMVFDKGELVVSQTGVPAQGTKENIVSMFMQLYN